MARLAIGAAIGIFIGVVVGAALNIRAEEEPTPETVEAAAAAGVDPMDLQGAANTTQLSPWVYLYAVGELAPPRPPVFRPLPGLATLAYIAAHSRYGVRAACVARIESSGGLRMWNAAPWGRFGEHAQSWFGWLPSTAASVGVRLGDLDSEIAGFDRMLDRGRGREYAGITWGTC
jgi:hypothetical protein